MSILTYNDLQKMSGYNEDWNTPGEVVAWLEDNKIDYVKGKHGRPSSLTEYFLAAKGYYIQATPEPSSEKEDGIQWD